MTTRTMRRAAVAATLALGPLVLAGSVPAAADAPAAVGWWSRQPGASAAPDGGFEVAAVGGEPASVAALRFQVEGSPSSATLTLAESGGTVTPATSLQVCTTGDAWQPANPGPYDDAPEADCTDAADLARDEETKEWTAEVAPLLSSGSLMVVPGEAPTGGSPLDPGFRVTFSAAELTVVAAPAVSSSPAFAEPSGGGGDSAAFPAPSSASPSSPAFDTGGGSGASTFDVPAADAPEASTTVTTVAVDEEAAEGADDGASEEAFGAPELAAGAGRARSSDRPWGRLLVFVPLSAAVGVASVRGRKLLEQRGVVEA